MAKLLVRWVDNPGAGTKKYDVVDVRDDSVEWGTREGFPSYLRVSLPGVTRAEAMFLTEIDYDPTGPLDPDTGKPTERRRSRLWGLRKIPPSVEADLDAAYSVSGEVVVQNAADLLAWVENKIDDSGRSEW